MNEINKKKMCNPHELHIKSKAEPEILFCAEFLDNKGKTHPYVIRKPPIPAEGRQDVPRTPEITSPDSQQGCSAPVVKKP